MPALRWLCGLVALGASMASAIAQPLSMTTICDDCKPVKFSTCGKGGMLLEGPSFDKDGALWLVALLSGTIYKVTPDGQCNLVSTIGGAPNGARLDGAGNLTIADKDRNLLTYNIQSGQTTVRRNKHGRETLRGLNDLVIDKRGGIYFTEPYGSHALKPNGRVFYLPPGSSDADGAAMTVLGDSFAFPNGLTLSPDETRLYVGDYATNRIFSLQLSAPGVMHPLGVPYVFATMTGGFGPDGMTVDSQGNLYVAHYRAGEVVVYNYNGFPYGSIRMPEDAGLGTTNVILRDGYLYIVDGSKDEVWRVKTKVAGLQAQ
jgi:gluconolactonase